MRIYIDKCGYNFNKAAATIENALTFTEGKYFDSCAALKKITKASLALTEIAVAISAAAYSLNFEKDPKGYWVLKTGGRGQRQQEKE